MRPRSLLLCRVRALSRCGLAGDVPATRSCLPVPLIACTPRPESVTDTGRMHRLAVTWEEWACCRSEDGQQGNRATGQHRQRQPSRADGGRMTDGGPIEVVRAWQASRGLSLRALAAAAPYDAGALSRILNGRKPVTAHVPAVLDDALDAAGEIVAAAEAEMASRLPRDMELTRRHLEDTISAGAMSAAELDDWQRAMMRYGYRTRDVPSPALLDG